MCVDLRIIAHPVFTSLFNMLCFLAIWEDNDFDGSEGQLLSVYYLVKFQQYFFGNKPLFGLNWNLLEFIKVMISVFFVVVEEFDFNRTTATCSLV